jgi:hypothetical protein
VRANEILGSPLLSQPLLAQCQLWRQQVLLSAQPQRLEPHRIWQTAAAERRCAQAVQQELPFEQVRCGQLWFQPWQQQVPQPQQVQLSVLGPKPL